MAAPIPRPMTHGSAKVPWEAKKPAASKIVSPGTGTPALSRKTPRNTSAYPCRARRFASSTGIVGIRELTRRQIEAGRRLQIRALGEQPRPRRARHALGFGDDRRLVQGQHAPVAHEPAPVHHHGFDVAGLALVHEARDGAQRGREVRAAEVDEDEVGAIARRQPAAVGNAERAIAVARGPRQRLLRRRLTAVGAAHALHEHRRAHDLHHVLGHVVGAERDETARALELVDARGETAARGDGGIDGDGGAGGAQRGFLLRAHAAKWAAIRRGDSKPQRATYSTGVTPRCSRMAATSPQIWLRWSVASTSSSSWSLRTRPSNSGEQRSGAHAATPALTRPSPRPCHRAWNSRMRARPASASAASRSNGPGWPIDARPRSHARSQSTSRRPVSASACA